MKKALLLSIVLLTFLISSCSKTGNPGPKDQFTGHLYECYLFTHPLTHLKVSLYMNFVKTGTVETYSGEGEQKHVYTIDTLSYIIEENKIKVTLNDGTIDSGEISSEKIVMKKDPTATELVFKRIR